MDYIDINSIVTEELNFDEELLKPIRESIAAQGCHHPLLVQMKEPPISFLGAVASVGIEMAMQAASEYKPSYKIIAGKKRFK